MKQLLNTLFVTTENIYLSLDGENVVANQEGQRIARYPLHTIQNIISFAYSGASPALMGACAKKGIGLAFCNQQGRFLARLSGENNGNVLLRREQYRMADNVDVSNRIAKNMIFGKIYNSKWVIERTCRDHALQVDIAKLRNASVFLTDYMKDALRSDNDENLRGIEGVAAKTYFDVFNEIILRDRDFFQFDTRSRRPPLDPTNAMLSFTYTLLAHDCASAAESVGLDSYVGFFHCDRPGRVSLALDLMEELRACVADRFVLTMINNRRVKKNEFLRQEDGAVTLTDDGRRNFLKAWQERKKELIKHPYLEERVPWGMVPYVQALLLARHVRGDLDQYPPFLWK